MSDKSYTDSGASDSTDMAQQANANKRVKLIPLGVKQRGLRTSRNPGSAKSEAISSQKVKGVRTSRTESSGNLSGNGSPDVKSLFGESDNRKHRRGGAANGMGPNAGDHDPSGDTTESDHSDDDSDEDSELDSDILDDRDEKEPGDPATATPAENQNRAITHFWPLRADGTEMTAKEYFHLKRHGFNFDYEPAAYRWDDGEAPSNREVLEVRTANYGQQADRFPMTLPSSVMNFENESYDFENPFHSPFYSGGSDGFMDAEMLD